MTTPFKIVVIGGGYAGTAAANRLRMRPGLDITLINPRPKFVNRVRLHQFVAGTGDAEVDYDTLLGAGVRLVVDTATRIDTATRTVALASGAALDFDYLIYAVGSTGSIPASVPGAAEFAFSVAEFEFARRLRDRLAELPADAPVTVVGGGLTGIETAAELAEQGRSITLVCGAALAPTFGVPARRALAKWLARHDVEVVEGQAVTEVRPAAVLAGGAPLPSALTIWATGFAVPELARDSGLSTDTLGRVRTDETLTSLDDDRVIATGDAAAPSDRPLRMSCYAAGPLGAQAADTVLSRLAGTEPPVINLRFSGACVSLGRRSAVRQLGRKDDTSVNAFVSGRLGAAIKELTCKYAVGKIRREASRPGSMIWPKAGPRPATTAEVPSS